MDYSRSGSVKEEGLSGSDSDVGPPTPPTTPNKAAVRLPVQTYYPQQGTVILSHPVNTCQYLSGYSCLDTGCGVVAGGGGPGGVLLGCGGSSEIRLDDYPVELPVESSELDQYLSQGAPPPHPPVWEYYDDIPPPQSDPQRYLPTHSQMCHPSPQQKKV